MSDSAPAWPPRPSDAPLEGRTGDDRGIAVTTHHLATETACDVLRRGGNAVDAAIAANAVIGVVLPDTCGPGGDLFALIHRTGDPRPAALNSSGRAGSGVTASDLRRKGHSSIPLRHPVSITVPGCVDGWEAMLDRFGSWSLADVLEPAIHHAATGFQVSKELAESLNRLQGSIGGQASAPPLYPDGAAPALGATIRRPDLAATLDEVGRGGRTAFFEGSVGDGIVAASGGAITPTDMQSPQAEWVDPLGLSLYGLQAWTIPPNSQGYLTLGATWIAKHMVPACDPGNPATHHALIEAYRALAWERDDFVTDPATAPLAPLDLVSPDRLESRLARVHADRPMPWPASRAVPGGTTYLCVRDGKGMGVSLIQSNFHGIGSGRSAGATGVFLHNRGAGFTLRSGHPNELVPGRRPLHTLSPTLWTDGTALRLLLGTRGGQYQPQLLIQFIAHHLGAGLALAAAQRIPRWVIDHWGAGEDSVVRVEPGMPTNVTEGLRTRGHTVDTEPEWQQGWGPVAAIRSDADGANGAADPRVSTASVGTE